MAVLLKTQPFDAYREMLEFEDQLQACGAQASFIGRLRDFNEGQTVHSMFLEHYPGMTEKQLEEIEHTAKTRWRVIDTLIIHRVGHIQIAEAIVLTAAWSAHRAEAFAACRFMIEELKIRAPFWKQETLPDGKRWVQKNTSREE